MSRVYSISMLLSVSNSTFFRIAGRKELKYAFHFYVNQELRISSTYLLTEKLWVKRLDRFLTKN